MAWTAITRAVPPSLFIPGPVRFSTSTTVPFMIKPPPLVFEGALPLSEDEAASRSKCGSLRLFFPNTAVLLVPGDEGEARRWRPCAGSSDVISKALSSSRLPSPLSMLAAPGALDVRTRAVAAVPLAPFLAVVILASASSVCSRSLSLSASRFLLHLSMPKLTLPAGAA